MNVSAVGGASAFYATVQRTSAAARPQAPTSAVDSDGDHDGSTVGGRVDVRA